MRLAFVSAATGLALIAGLSAASAEPLAVEVDQTTIMTLTETPGAVVVGNPSIADVTIQADKLLVHGRTFGTTNVIILNQDGEQMMSLDVSVKHEPDNLVAVFRSDFRGANRLSYSCAPLCQSELQVGDDVVYTSVLTEQIKNKSKLATGEEDSKSEAPPAPQ